MEDKHLICSKVKYASEEYALFDVKRIKKKSTRDKKPLRAYLCFCGAWHLTSKVDKKDIIIHDLKLKIIELETTIRDMAKNQNKEDRIEFRKDERLIELKKENKTIRESNVKLRQTNSKLVGDVIQLKNQLEKKDSDGSKN